MSDKGIRESVEAPPRDAADAFRRELLWQPSLTPSRRAAALEEQPKTPTALPSGSDREQKLSEKRPHEGDSKPRENPGVGDGKPAETSTEITVERSRRMILHFSGRGN